MKNLTVFVDTDTYRWKNNGEYSISGWRVSMSEEPIEIVALADEKDKIPFKVQYYERPDVFANEPELASFDKNIGFTITFFGFAACFGKYQNLKVTMTQGEEEILLIDKEVCELEKFANETSIMSNLDFLQLRGQKVVMTGWAVDALMEDQLTLLDGNGKELVCDIGRTERKDVLKNLDLVGNDNCGFMVAVLRELVKTDTIQIVIKNHVSEQRITIDMKKFDRENSKWKRLKDTLRVAEFEKNKKIIQKEGFNGFLDYLKFQMNGEEEDYIYWTKLHFATDKILEKESRAKFDWSPKISIVIPLYNTPIRYLSELIDCFIRQSYKNWELCLADGSTKDEVGEFIQKRYGGEKRILYKRLTDNTGIAGNTNAAIAMASGDFVMFSDHDDLVEPDALFEIVRVINKDRKTDIVYTDEDLVDSMSTEYSSPRFKPDFNLDYIRSINYICHIFVVRKTLLDEVGGLRARFDGAQDWDFVLRCCEKTTHIHHIPKILYHWRAHPDSTAGNPESKHYAIDAAKRALEEHYQRLNIDATVEETDVFIILKTTMHVIGSPKVSVIILNKDHAEDLDKCLTSIFEKTTYDNYEVIVVENNSEESETFEYYEKMQKEHENLKVVVWDGPFNYSAINNYGAKFASGEYYILLNNDTEVISPDWMSDMLGYCQREDVGIVGAKLYYEDDTVQHAGVTIGVGGFAGHILTGTKREDRGYFGRLVAIQDVSAVTAACLMIKKSTYEKIGGFDEDFVVALNDVDLCLKVRELGELIVFNPYVELHHYESKSRGFEDTKEKQQRFKKEIKRFRDKWGKIIEEGDPYYNPNLTLMYGDCSLRRRNESFEIIDEIEGEK